MEPVPLIGLTENLGHEKRRAYVDAVIQTGARAIWLPLLSSKKAWLDYVRKEKISGVILTGGADINPARYNQQLISQTRLMPEEKEKSDMLLIEACMDMEVPVLGICLGIQEINVFFGGTLHQHLPEQIKNLNFAHKNYFLGLKHIVKILKDSKLYNVVKTDMLEVNSYHHQGINHLGTGLKITGVSDDGIVEAIELESRPNVMGVQWHPERMLYNPLHKILFTWFKSEQT